MGRFFISRLWRLPKLAFALILLEFPFTVANLTLFGIAAPDTYRTVLWKFGGEMGWNSDPSTVAYAAYNYKPVNTPIVWSSLNTNYNMYVGVVCMFFWLIKVTLWVLHVFYPIFSLMLHIPLAALWAASLYLQTASDTVDPDPARHNKGAPWYITKSCAVATEKETRGYCQQAKSAFAVSVIMLFIYIVFLALTIYSLIPTHTARLAHATKQAEKKAEKELYASEPSSLPDMTPQEQWQHMWELQQLPRTPGTAATSHAPWRAQQQVQLPPVTPRTRAFNELQGVPGTPGAAPGAGYVYPPPAAANGGYFPEDEYAGVHQQQYQQPQRHPMQPPQQSVGYAGVQVPAHGVVDEDEYVGYRYDGKGKGTAV